MSDIPKEETPKMVELGVPSPGSLLTMIADISNQQDRRHDSVVKRLEVLERDRHGSSANDPEKIMVQVVLFLIFVQFVLPLLGRMLDRWLNSLPEGQIV